MVVDYVGVDVHVKFGDCRSNGSRDISGAHFVSNERTNMIEAYHIVRVKRLIDVTPTN